MRTLHDEESLHVTAHLAPGTLCCQQGRLMHRETSVRLGAGMCAWSHSGNASYPEHERSYTCASYLKLKQEDSTDHDFCDDNMKANVLCEGLHLCPTPPRAVLQQNRGHSVKGEGVAWQIGGKRQSGVTNAWHEVTQMGGQHSVSEKVAYEWQETGVLCGCREATGVAYSREEVVEAACSGEVAVGAAGMVRWHAAVRGWCGRRAAARRQCGCGGERLVCKLGLRAGLGWAEIMKKMSSIQDSQWVGEDVRVAGSVEFGRGLGQETLKILYLTFSNVLVLDSVIQCTKRNEFFVLQVPGDDRAHPDRKPPCPKKVLIISGSDGGVVREVLKPPSVEQVVLCDIDDVCHLSCTHRLPTNLLPLGRPVVRVARLYLLHMATLLTLPHVRVHIGNGFAFLATYNAIITNSSHPVNPTTALFQSPYAGGGVWVTAMWVYAWGQSDCGRLVMWVACGLQEAGQGYEGQWGGWRKGGWGRETKGCVGDGDSNGVHKGWRVGGMTWDGSVCRWQEVAGWVARREGGCVGSERRRGWSTVGKRWEGGGAELEDVTVYDTEGEVEAACGGKEAVGWRAAARRCWGWRATARGQRGGVRQPGVACSSQWVEGAACGSQEAVWACCGIGIWGAVLSITPFASK
ncbi:hypothetical protein K439DRAFT_1527122 [Ramaria rubella]|nr:hypothetical protein K439DRAFT_1527122 [Ramaria rubella]